MLLPELEDAAFGFVWPQVVSACHRFLKCWENILTKDAANCPGIATASTSLHLTEHCYARIPKQPQWETYSRLRKSPAKTPYLTRGC